MEPTETRAYPVCASCGSENVVCDAWASWNKQIDEWELDNTFDDGFCRDCEHTGALTWIEPPETPAQRTRRLNDEMRAKLLEGDISAYGSVMMTRGVAERGPLFTTAAARAVATFNDFSKDNDPHGEHDFGTIEVAGEKLFWKIDFYDLELTAHSPDKSDIGVTHRVLTIMLASEY